MGELLPQTRDAMAQLGWAECDCIVVTGDAYVDHPAFGAALIARVLLDAGFRTGIIAQPRWDRLDDFQVLGRPRLFFGITSGNVDSMVAHYSPLLQRRRADDYSPGGRIGLRPNRAVIVYANRLRQAYPGVKLVLGGIEASLRRLAHYDYWDDAVRRSILLDAKADIIAYGMAEHAVIEIARRLARGQDLRGIPGTVIALRVRDASTSQESDCVELPGLETVANDKTAFLTAFRQWYQESDQPLGKTVMQSSGDQLVVQYPPAMPLAQSELDQIYDLPFTRRPGLARDRNGALVHTDDIPALVPVQYSITSHRGCLGRCTFCSISVHQGRIIQWRSRESILREAQQIAQLPNFKGHITDVGGPTANMYGANCPLLSAARPCRDRDCLFPNRCLNLRTSLEPQLQVLAAVRQLPGVKKVSLGTGLRYDLVQDARELASLVQHYVSGQLRVAPEHVVPSVLRLMRKTTFTRYEAFASRFLATSRRLGKRQYLIPYFMSSFPGCRPEDMLELAEYLARAAASGQLPHNLRQVQDFTPLPMTPAATMYYVGTDPFTGEDLHVARDKREKKLQRALLQLPANYRYVVQAFTASGRYDLVARVRRLKD